MTTAEASYGLYRRRTARGAPARDAVPIGQRPLVRADLLASRHPMSRDLRSLVTLAG
jgi:hypothetical protein